MSRKIQLTIPEPCHENWDNMTAADKGRFCGSCQKQVVDFSDMSDREIAQFFKKPSTGSVCGRFMQDQLERPIEVPRKRIPWIKYFFQFALPAFLFSLKTSGQNNKMGKLIVKTQPQRPLMGDTIIRSEEMISGMTLAKLQPTTVVVSNTSAVAFCQPLQSLSGKVGGVMLSYINIERTTELKGKVIDENREPVPYASVMLNGTSFGKQALEDGSFIINTGKKWEKAELVISSVGFEEKKVEVNRKDLTNEGLVIQLQSKNKLDEIKIISSYGITKGRIVMGTSFMWGQQISFTDTVKKIFTPIENKFILYPNPVHKGNPFVLEITTNQQKKLSVVIVDAGGRQMNVQPVQTVKGINKIDINTDNRWPAGIYFIKLLDAQNELIKTEQIVIQ